MNGAGDAVVCNSDNEGNNQYEEVPSRPRLRLRPAALRGGDHRALSRRKAANGTLAGTSCALLHTNMHVQ